MRAIGLISVDSSLKEDRILFDQATKFVAIVITFGQAMS